MQYTIWHFFYLRECGQAYDTDAIERTFAALSQSGWAVDAYPPVATPVCGATSYVSTEARVAMRRYVEGQADELRFVASTVAQGDDLTFDMSLHPDYGTLMLSVESFTFEDYDGVGKGLVRYLRWLDMVRRLYAIWRPIYGFESASGMTEGFVEREDALELNVTSLFSMANVFGPEFVAKLGRERLLSAPAAYVAPLADGGVLLTPRIYTSLDALPPELEKAPDGTGAILRLDCRDAQAVARHIGGALEAFDWDTYLRERARLLYNATRQAAS